MHYNVYTTVKKQYTYAAKNLLLPEYVLFSRLQKTQKTTILCHGIYGFANFFVFAVAKRKN